MEDVLAQGEVEVGLQEVGEAEWCHGGEVVDGRGDGGGRHGGGKVGVGGGREC